MSDKWIDLETPFVDPMAIDTGRNIESLVELSEMFDEGAYMLEELEEKSGIPFNAIKVQYGPGGQMEHTVVLGTEIRVTSKDETTYCTTFGRLIDSRSWRLI